MTASNEPQTGRTATYQSYMNAIYSTFNKPKFSTKSQEWENAARASVPAANFMYVYGSAGQNRTYAANLAAFDRYRLIPSMLIDATVKDTSVTLFGKNYRSPILVAPVGVQNIMHKDGEEATARACEAVGVPMILSTAATRTIEQVAKANGDGDRWYQLYWPTDDAITLSLLSRAKAEGFTTLVVTLDTFQLGWRPGDLDNSYLPFLWGDGCQIGHSDPVFNAKYEAGGYVTAASAIGDSGSILEKLYGLSTLVGRASSPKQAIWFLMNASKIKKSLAWLAEANSGRYKTWEDLKILRDNWSGPIVLKGIQTVADAHRAIAAGIDGIVVSNHGGRQVDGAIASLDALAEIAADPQAKEKLTILFDSGIRSGSDVVKAMALGAQAVLVARPYMYGLAMGGQEGVEHVLRCLLAETEVTMGLAGITSLAKVDRSVLKVEELARL